MPIYEFYCGSCHVVFSFFAKRVDTTLPGVSALRQAQA